MENDIIETCGECRYFVDKRNYSSCHYEPPQFQLTSLKQEADTGRKGWWTFPVVNADEVACGCFEERSRKC